MKEQYKFLAFDLGAESGRAVLGTLAGGKIELEVIHRFRTEGLMMLGVRQWDLTRIYEDMITGLHICAKEHTTQLDGIGVDTWGVDFGLVAEDGTVLGNPVHYRDKRNDGMQEKAFTKVSREDIYKGTGIQYLPFNTNFQLLSLVESNSPILKAAETLLMMGDVLGYLLSGAKACEYSGASTTQLLDPHTRKWNDGLIEALGIPRRLFPDPVDPGSVIGTLLPEIAATTGLDAGIPIIAPCTHDTGAAVASVPVTDTAKPWAYLSSGTWSLLGAELDEPEVSEASLAASFTNEGGAGGKIRFLKNIFGLWLVQECRRAWEREGTVLDYGTITREAADAKPFGPIIDLDDERLLAPEHMPEMIQTLCKESGQAVPETRGEITRCALESLAVKYRDTLADMDGVLGRKTEKLHIIGGGTQNKLLSQMTADACGIPVVTGPIEATALGNIGVQAMGVGVLASLDALRSTVAASVELETYMPENTEAWSGLGVKG